MKRPKYTYRLPWGTKWRLFRCLLGFHRWGGQRVANNRWFYARYHECVWCGAHKHVEYHAKQATPEEE